MGFASKCSKAVLLVAILLGVAVQVLKNYSVMRGMGPIFVKENNFKPEDIPDLTGQTILVTGANAGLGKSTAKLLAVKNADVIMGCRSMKKCNQALGDIKREAGKHLADRLHPMVLDLGSLQSIKEFSDKVNKKFTSLNSLILNAGVMGPEFGLTVDGIETQFGVNHVGHFYLTKLLLPMVEKAGKGTIVAVSSLANFHSYSDEPVRLTLKQINSEAEYDQYSAYGQSKLANVLFAQELSKQMKEKGAKVFVNAIHPGGVRTELTRHYFESGTPMDKVFDALVDSVFFAPDQAALTEIYAAVSPEIFEKGITGKYFHPIADLFEPSESAKNMTLQKGLWKFTEELIAQKGF